MVTSFFIFQHVNITFPTNEWMHSVVAVIFFHNIVLLECTTSATSHLRVHPHTLARVVHVHCETQHVLEELLATFRFSQKPTILLKCLSEGCFQVSSVVISDLSTDLVVFVVYFFFNFLNSKMCL